MAHASEVGQRSVPRRRNGSGKHWRPAALEWVDSHWRWADDGALVLTLPVPGSANRQSRSGKGRVFKPKDVREYEEAAGWAMASCPKLAGEVSVDIVWYRKAKVGDVDNRIKPLLDTLKDVAFGDDAVVQRLSIARIDSDEVRACVVVAIRPAQ